VPEGLWSASRAFGGRIALASATPSADVAVTAPGFGIAILRDVRGEREVRLTPGLPVDLTVDGDDFASLVPVVVGLELPAPRTAGDHDFYWGTSDPFVVQRGDPRALGTSKARLASPGTVRLRVPAPGRYRVRLDFDPDNRDLALAPAVVEVGPQGAAAKVRFTAEQIRALAR
jgi:hypothetical protein